MRDPISNHPLELKYGDVVLVCEGGDECAMVRHMTRDWPQKLVAVTRNDRDDDARNLGWNAQFKQFCSLAAQRQIRALGLIFDAEPTRQQAQRRISAMYDAANWRPPPRENQSHVVRVDGVEIRTGYLLNPPQNPGCLESLFLRQIQDAPIGECIRDVVACYESQTGKALTNRAKVIVRTFLAYSNPDNTGLTIALRDALLECSGSQFDRVRSFLQRLAAKSE